jgi:hypothetical protein
MRTEILTREGFTQWVSQHNLNIMKVITKKHKATILYNGSQKEVRLLDQGIRADDTAIDATEEKDPVTMEDPDDTHFVVQKSKEVSQENDRRKAEAIGKYDTGTEFFIEILYLET